MMIADASRRSSAIDVDAIVPRESLRRAGFQAAAAALALALVLFASRGPARQAVDAASLTLFPERVNLSVTPGNAKVKAGTRADHRGAAGRQPRAGDRAAAGRRRRSLARQRDDERVGWRVPPVDPVDRRAVQVPRRRRRGDVADLRDRRGDPAARDPHRRALHLSRRAAAAAADRDRRRRHLRAGRHRRARPGVHRSSRGQRRDDARRRQADRAERGGAEPAVGIADGEERRLLSAAARRSRRRQRRRRHRVLHPHARGSAARRPRPQAGDRSIGDAARGSGHRGAGRGRLRRRSPRAGLHGEERREGRAADRSRAAASTSPASTRCFSKSSTSSRATSSRTTCARAI